MFENTKTVATTERLFRNFWCRLHERDFASLKLVVFVGESICTLNVQLTNSCWYGDNELCVPSTNMDM